MDAEGALAAPAWPAHLALALQALLSRHEMENPGHSSVFHGSHVSLALRQKLDMTGKFGWGLGTVE